MKCVIKNSRFLTKISPRIIYVRPNDFYPCDSMEQTTSLCGEKGSQSNPIFFNDVPILLKSFDPNQHILINLTVGTFGQNDRIYDLSHHSGVTLRGQGKELTTVMGRLLMEGNNDAIFNIQNLCLRFEKPIYVYDKKLIVLDIKQKSSKDSIKSLKINITNVLIQLNNTIDEATIIQLLRINKKIDSMNPEISFIDSEIHLFDATILSIENNSENLNLKITDSSILAENEKIERPLFLCKHKLNNKEILKGSITIRTTEVVVKSDLKTEKNYGDVNSAWVLFDLNGTDDFKLTVIESLLNFMTSNTVSFIQTRENSKVFVSTRNSNISKKNQGVGNQYPMLIRRLYDNSEQTYSRDSNNMFGESGIFDIKVFDNARLRIGWRDNDFESNTGVQSAFETSGKSKIIGQTNNNDFIVNENGTLREYLIHGQSEFTWRSVGNALRNNQPSEKPLSSVNVQNDASLFLTQIRAVLNYKMKEKSIPAVQCFYKDNSNSEITVRNQTLSSTGGGYEINSSASAKNSITNVGANRSVLGTERTINVEENSSVNASDNACISIAGSLLHADTSKSNIDANLLYESKGNKVEGNNQDMSLYFIQGGSGDTKCNLSSNTVNGPVISKNEPLPAIISIHGHETRPVSAKINSTSINGLSKCCVEGDKANINITTSAISSSSSECIKFKEGSLKCDTTDINNTSKNGRAIICGGDGKPANIQLSGCNVKVQDAPVFEAIGKTDMTIGSTTTSTKSEIVAIGNDNLTILQSESSTYTDNNKVGNDVILENVSNSLIQN